MRVTALIVTYANRYRLLEKVIHSCLEQGIDSVVLVDNGSHPDSARQLVNLQNKTDKIKVFRFKENQGSSLAFKKAIEIWLNDEQSEFAWLLDDDNLPEQGALSSLMAYWSRSDFENKDEKLMLSSIRKSRGEVVSAIQHDNPWQVLPPVNSFLGFHMSTITSKVMERFAGYETSSSLPREAKLIVAPYGGLFFSRRVFRCCNLPRDEYVLYLDDFEFTLNFSKNGGTIVCVTDSRIVDLELSDFQTTEKKLLFHSIYDSSRDSSVYYASRNLLRLQLDHLVDNRLIFSLNKLIFLFYIFTLGVLRLKFGRMHLFYKAISDARNNVMGKSFPLP